MDLDPLIGSWKRYPEKRELFEATFFIYFESGTELLFQVNANPSSFVGTLYSISVTRKQLCEFISAMYTGRNHASIEGNGFFKRKYKVQGKYALSETVYLWKIPVGYQSFTVSVNTAKRLFKDFCEV